MFLFHSWYVNARVCSKYEDFLFRGFTCILVSKLLKQGYSSRKRQTTFRKFYGRHTDLIHKFDTSVSVSHMLKGLFTNCDTRLVSSYLGVNRDWWHMWGRKCSLFPEHLISLPLGNSWFHRFIIYTLHNLSVLGLCVRINDWFVCLDLFAWISLTALSWTLFQCLTRPKLYVIKIIIRCCCWGLF